MLQELSNCGTWRVAGSLNPKVLIAGHSHTFSMFEALNSSDELSQIFGIVTQADFSKHVHQDNNYWNFVVDSANSQPTVISWNGNQHNIHFLIDDQSKFKAQGLSESENYSAVSLARIKELFTPTFYELGLYLSRFKSRANLSLVGTPPPLPKKVLDKRIIGDIYFGELAKGLGIAKKDVRASSDELRTFMWRITQDLAASKAAEFGCKFIPTPCTSYDLDSVLLEKYWSNDLTHANKQFGILMLEEIRRVHGF